MADDVEQETGADADVGGWVPEFEGQRPPFAPGHTLSPTTHGAYSPRRVEPLAREFVELVLADEGMPAHVKATTYRAELLALGRAEAQVQLVSEWLMTQGEESGDGVGDLGDPSVRAAYLLMHRAEARAASSRSRLGLTPVAAARLGKHVAQGQVAQVDVALRMAQLHELERAGWTPPEGWSPEDGGVEGEGVGGGE